MLPDHIKAHLFGFYHVKLQGLISRSGVKAIGPPALIQRTVLEQELILQEHPLYSVGSCFHGYFTHGKIRPHLILHFPFTDQ
ncbi:hypothetical protein D9M69_511800 [compost metagenome]